MTSKRYYWIKLKTDFFNLDEIDFLLSQKNGSDYVVLYQMLCLKTANTNGSLITKLGEMIVPYDIEKIVRDTKHFTFDTVTVAMELYKKLGLIFEEENGCLKISNHDDMVGSEAANANAQRQKRFRERKKLEQSVTNSNGDSNKDSNSSNVTETVTQSVMETSPKITKRLESRVKSLDIRDKILDDRDWEWEWDESDKSLNFNTLAVSLGRKKLLHKNDDVKTFDEIIKKNLEDYEYLDVAIESEHILRKMKEDKIENRLAYFNSSLKNNLIERKVAKEIKVPNIFEGDDQND